jgi:hypothetical protein
MIRTGPTEIKHPTILNECQPMQDGCINGRPLQPFPAPAVDQHRVSMRHGRRVKAWLGFLAGVLVPPASVRPIRERWQYRVPGGESGQERGIKGGEGCLTKKDVGYVEDHFPIRG